MPIVRAPHDTEHPYTPMDNGMEGVVSGEAIGLLYIMLKNRDDWDFNQANLMRRVKYKRTQFEHARDELISAGYLRIIQKRNNGKFHNEWIVHELPDLNEPPRSNPKPNIDHDLPIPF